MAAEQIRLDSSFLDDLGADSVDVVELVMEFEQEFDVTIPDDEAARIARIRTVADAIRYIIGHRGEAT